MKDVKAYFQDQDSKKKPRKISRKAVLKGDDVLEAIGHENEDVGAKATIETQRASEKQERELVGNKIEELTNSRVTKQRYQLKLARQLYDLCQNVDWPKGFNWKIGLKDNDKISLEVMDRKGYVYGSGIKITGIPLYDMNALQIIVNQAENTVDKLEGNLAWQRKTSKLVYPETTILKADGTPHAKR